MPTMSLELKRRYIAPQQLGETTSTTKEEPDGNVRPIFSSWTLPKGRMLLASVIHHSPGLFCVFRYNDNPVIFLRALIGAMCEGCCVFLLLGILMKTYEEGKRNVTPTWKELCIGSMVIGLGLVVVVAALLFPLGDFYFQSSAGGEIAGCEYVITSLRYMKAMFQFAANGHSEYASGYCMIQAAASLAAIIALLKHGDSSTSKSMMKLSPQRSWKINSQTLLVAVASTALAYFGLGAWSPVFHCSLCVAKYTASNIFVGGAPSPRRLHSMTTTPRAQRETANLRSPSSSQFGVKAGNVPNVILLLHDTLSGTALLRTENGRKATPFFQSLRNDPNFYLFPNARSLSGSTDDCVPPILSGCLPFTQEGRDASFQTWIGSEFKRMGRSTATFSSPRLDDKTSPTYMVSDFLQMDMDVVVDPLSEGHPFVNMEASDDRFYVPIMKQWVQKQKAKNDGPFFSAFYSFNAHYPYVRDDAASRFPNDPKLRYFSALETLDDFFKQLFAMLEETGQLDNTIIVGTSDHGESSHDSKPFARAMYWDPRILSAASFMYIPESLFPSQEARDNLLHNLNKTVSTLDIFPTLQHILYQGNMNETADIRKQNDAVDIHSHLYQHHCLTGVDLMSEKISDDRIVPHWNPVHWRKYVPVLAAFSNAETGIYLRRAWSHRNGFFEMDFRPSCTSNWENSCVEKLRPESRLYWKKAIADMYNSSAYSPALKESKLMMFLEKHLNREWDA